MPYLAALDSIAPEGLGRDAITGLIRSRIVFLKNCADRADDIADILSRRRVRRDAIFVRTVPFEEHAVDEGQQRMQSETLVEAAQWQFCIDEMEEGVETLRSAVAMAPPLTSDSDPIEIARVSLLSALSQGEKRDSIDGEPGPWPLSRHIEAMSLRRLAQALNQSPYPVTQRSFTGERPGRSPASAAPESAIIELVDRQRFGGSISPLRLMQDEKPDFEIAVVSAILTMERNYAVRIAMIAQEWSDRAKMLEDPKAHWLPYLRAELIDWRLLASHVALKRADIGLRLPETEDDMGAVAFIRALAGEWP